MDEVTNLLQPLSIFSSESCHSQSLDSAWTILASPVPPIGPNFIRSVIKAIISTSPAIGLEFWFAAVDCLKYMQKNNIENLVVLADEILSEWIEYFDTQEFLSMRET
jgi:hypothetical protein